MKYNPTLQALTDALQELQRRREDPDRKPVELPKTLDSRDMPLSPEVDKFLRERREYFERTKNISTCEYGFAF